MTTALEKIVALDVTLATLPPQAALTVEQGRVILAGCKAVALWCAALSRGSDSRDRAIHEIQDELGMPLP